MARSTAESTKQKGDIFEKQIADLYSAMAYSVKQNVPLAGQQVDFIATRNIPGGGEYVVIVECKYKGGRALATNQDVQSIAGAFQIARTANQANACVLVTTNGFSLDAQTAAKAAGIHLTTKSELIRNLIDFKSYLEELRRSYSADFGEDHESWYIDASGRERGEAIESLDDFVDQWLCAPDKKPLALLGGYGTGKSSFCRHYAVKLAERDEGPIPIIIQLREFPEAGKIESLVRDFLEEKCRTYSPHFDTFWRMYSEGMLLIFFDGLDEMAVRADASVLESNLVEIEKFTRAGSNVVLTCRREFFLESREEDAAFRPSVLLSDRVTAYTPIEIDLWNPMRVDRYVRRRIAGMQPSPSRSAEYYLEQIHNLPQLSDVSARAVHLDLIVRMLPTMVGGGIPITRTNLYGTYIQSELRRETITNRRLRLISDEDRVLLLRAIAADRLVETSDVLEFASASTVIAGLLAIPKSEIESVTRDFLNRSFLVRKGDIYHFAHRSIGDYLCALEIASRIRNGDLQCLVDRRHSTAVAGMVLELFGGLEHFRTLLNALHLSKFEVAQRDTLPLMAFAAISLGDYIDGLAYSSRLAFREGEPTPVIRLVNLLVHDMKGVIHSFMLLNDLIFRRKGQIRDESSDPILNKERLHDVSHRWRVIVDTIERMVELEPAVVDSEYESVDLMGIIRSCLNRFQRHEVEILGSCDDILGDAVKLFRIFDNLASNAQRAMGPNGRVVVEIRDGRDAVEVRFTNTGEPIKPSLLPQIFEPYFTTRVDGSGLGLFIVKTLMESLGGDIQVQPKGHRTTFALKFPRVATPQS